MQFPKINIIQQGLWRPNHAPQRTPLRFVLYYELEIHHETRGKTVINGEEMECFDGLISFARPGDLRYSSRPEEAGFSRDFVCFELESDPGGLWSELLRQIPSHLTRDEQIARLWQEFLSYYGERKNELRRLQAHMSLYSLLIYLSEQKGMGPGGVKQPSTHQQALFQTICYMREHLGENLAIGDIARHIGYSTSHFNHLFKTYTKITPYAYYLSLRLGEARRLLINTSMSISQIAESLSFGNTGKFSYAFKNDCGMTPGQFRKTYERGDPLTEI